MQGCAGGSGTVPHEQEQETMSPLGSTCSTPLFRPIAPRRSVFELAEILNELTQNMLTCTPILSHKTKKPRKRKPKRRHPSHVISEDIEEIEQGIELGEEDILKKAYSFNRV